MTTSESAIVASTETIREDFPALERVHAGEPVAYFDCPGGTQVPGSVASAMLDYLFNHNANAKWAFPTSAETDAARAHARLVYGVFLNCAPNEVVFGANMTTLTFHLSRAIGRRLGPGDEIVVTELDHHANVGPWTALEAERGVTVRWVRLIPETGQIDWEHLTSLVGDRTKVVAIGAASNAIGTISNVRAAADIAHTVDALIFVDGVHYAPNALVDVSLLDCDFFVCSPYKCYGPHLGVLYGRYDLLADLEFPSLVPAPDTAPERAETGTLNHEGMVGAAAAVEWLASLADAGDSLRSKLRYVYDALHERGTRLLGDLWNGLVQVPGVRLYGPSPDSDRTPTIGFTVHGVASRDVAQFLGERGVFTSHGDFYAHTVIERLGLQPEGLVRAGCACYTTEEDVSRLLDGVRALV
jgi:cysteine desulfurase family protein (TIGR01976 family)